MPLHSRDEDNPSGIRWVNLSPALSNVASQLLLMLKTSYQGLNSPPANSTSAGYSATSYIKYYIQPIV